MKKAALFLASLVVSLALAEVAYRIATAPDPNAADGFDYEWRERYIRMNETIYRPSADPRRVYEPTPSSAVEMEYGVAGFNAQAMRELRDVARTPTPNTRRVAVVGDSLTWGEFLAAPQAPPQQLGAELGEGYEVLNFGVSGYDTSDEAAWYDSHVRHFGADIVVVLFCMNDVMIMSGPFERYADDNARARKDAQEVLLEALAPIRRETIDDVVHHNEKYAWFKLWARFEGILMRRRFDAAYDDEYLVMGRQPDARARFADAVRELGASIARDGATPVLVISPVLESFDDYHWHRLHDWVRDEAQSAGFLVHDPLDEFQRERSPEELRVSGDNLHYGADGARVLAQSIAEFVEGLAP